jgi:hypothetical protein
MNEANLKCFRNISQLMINPTKQPEDWEWQGKWMSQRMVGITEQRAKEMASRYGGEAKKMQEVK